MGKTIRRCMRRKRKWEESEATSERKRDAVCLVLRTMIPTLTTIITMKVKTFLLTVDFTLYYYYILIYHFCA